MAYDPLKNFSFEDLEVSDTYEVRFLPITSLKDSKENAERTADFRSRPEDVESFKDQLEKIGLLDPLHVVAIGDDRYKIISGHYRRYCLEQLFKEGRTVTYKGRVLDKEVPCIIDDTTDEDQMVMNLVAANSRNNSVDEKIYRTKMAMDLHSKLLQKGDKDITPNRNDFIAMITGFSKRSVQTYINQINAKDSGVAKKIEADEFDLAKATKKAKALVKALDKDVDDIDELQAKMERYSDADLMRFNNELCDVIDTLTLLCTKADDIVTQRENDALHSGTEVDQEGE